MQWKRLIPIIRCPHSWCVFLAFGGLIRKANTDTSASYLRTIVADEVEDKERRIWRKLGSRAVSLARQEAAG